MAKSKYYKRPDGLFESIRTINGKRVAFRGKSCREVDRKILDYREEVEKGWTFQKASDQWYEAKEKEVRHATYRSYGNTLRRLQDRFGAETVSEITPDEICAYIREFERKGYSRDTVQLEISVLRMVFDYAVNHRTESGLAYNPALSVRKSKGLPYRKRPALTEEQERLVQIAASKQIGEWWLLGYFLMYSGCRRGEALALSYSDIDRRRGVICINKKLNYDAVNVPVLEGFTKSENGMREIPLLKPLADALPKNRVGLLFPSPATGDFLTRYELTKIWKQYCIDTGLTEKDENGKTVFPVSPHCFRHSFATICFESGIDARSAAAFLGDSVSVMERVYVELRNSHKDGAISALDQFVQSRERAAK